MTKLTKIQIKALKRIRCDHDLRQYEFELMTDWAYMASQEHWDWVFRATTDDLVKFAEEVRDEFKAMHGEDFIPDVTWQHNIGVDADAGSDVTGLKEIDAEIERVRNHAHD